MRRLRNKLSVWFELMIVFFIQKNRWSSLATTAPWVETVWNRRVHCIDENLFNTSLGVSEQAREQAEEWARERSKLRGASKWVSGASEWANVCICKRSQSLESPFRFRRKRILRSTFNLWIRKPWPICFFFNHQRVTTRRRFLLRMRRTYISIMDPISNYFRGKNEAMG